MTELESAEIQAVSAQSLATGKSAELAREELARASGANITVLSIEDTFYPSRLKENLRSSPILYVRGNPAVLTEPGMAVVGTRHPTPYGSGMAERLACDLAAQGLVIISGMARGVDTAGHRGTISAKGKTVAVFGAGVDVISPKKNSRLSERILALAEHWSLNFPWAPSPLRRIFPFASAFSAGCPSACSWSKPPNILVRASPRASRSSRTGDVFAVQCHQQEFLGTEHTHQKGRQAGRDLGRSVGGSPHRSATCADSRLVP